MKLGIVGSRDFTDYEYFKSKLDPVKAKIDHVVSGGAKGADYLAEKWAADNNISITIYRPQWDKHGKSAGYKRNELIVDDSNAIVAFQVEGSKGTQHTIDITNKKNKPIKVYKINK